MTRSARIRIADVSLACAQGASRDAVARTLFAADCPAPARRFPLIGRRDTPVAALPVEPPDLPGESSRTNRLLAMLLDQIGDSVAQRLSVSGPKRLAVVIGTSTTGIDEATHGLRVRLSSGDWPPGFDFGRQLLGDTSRFAARRIGAEGPAYTISTACTSGAKALAAGARLLRAGLADHVVCGGVDTLCELTLNGFAALESVTSTRCNPMSANRDGIMIGEGGAMFLLERGEGDVELAGWGETSDAHHISAPDPSGAGGERAVRMALDRAGLDAADIGHVHMHGTATRLNDEMEAGLVDRVFGRDIAASSTKGLTGHTLGAAGAIQAALSVIAMDLGVYPPHAFDGVRDPALPDIRLARPGETADRRLDAMVAMSFAFGGNNQALVLRRGGA